jgi:hypothetical protein
MQNGRALPGHFYLHDKKASRFALQCIFKAAIASAIAMVRFAISTCNRSTICPSS